MSVSVKIDAADVQKMLGRLERVGSEGRALTAKIAQRVTQDHFRTLAQSRHRGGGEDWYGRAAGSTTGRVQGSNIVVSIAHEGIGLRRFGGTVRPGAGKKYLAIPDDDNAQAQRRSPRDIDGLHFRPHRDKHGDAGRLCDVTGRVFYWLTSKTDPDPDPSVLPTDGDFSDAIVPELEAKLERI